MVAVGVALGVADSEADGDSVGTGPAPGPVPEIAKPPMISVRTSSPEPEPIKTSRR